MKHTCWWLTCKWSNFQGYLSFHIEHFILDPSFNQSIYYVISMNCNQWVFAYWLFRTQNTFSHEAVVWFQDVGHKNPIKWLKIITQIFIPKNRSFWYKWIKIKKRAKRNKSFSIYVLILNSFSHSRLLKFGKIT